MPDKYILDGKTPVLCSDVRAFSDWFEKADRTVALDVINGSFRVSTVFLGVDHNFSGGGRPILFETMIFKGESWDELYMRRCSTWEEAEAQHQEAIRWLREEGLA